MEKNWLLHACLVVLVAHQTCGYSYSTLQCHRCKKASSHEACNHGIEVCRKDYTACITKTEKKKGGKIQITKGCSKPKYCKDPQPNCDRKGNKCSFCCYHDMCNVRNYPNPDNTDPCGCKPCLNGGRCERNWFKFSCSCKPGFTGRYCENRLDKPDPCRKNPCKNGGACWSCNGKWNCNCPPAYIGTKCEKHIDPCKPDNPCLNGGKCKSSGATYECRCKSGFDGDHCEHEKNACSSQPCQNGGTCQSHYCGYTCLCRPGFSGDDCHQKMENCFLCPREGGFYKDPFDCHKFYQCCGWVPYHKDCPTDLHFNDKTGRCDWPWNADCTAQGWDPDEQGSTCGVEQSRDRRQLMEDAGTFFWEEEEDEERRSVWDETVEEELKEEDEEKRALEDHRVEEELKEEDGEKRAMADNTVEEELKEEDGEKRAFEDHTVEEELEEQEKETAREFVEKNEEKIGSILDALMEIEDELKMRE